MASKPGIHTKDIPQGLILPRKNKLPIKKIISKHNSDNGQSDSPIKRRRSGKKDDSTKFRNDLFWIYKEWGGKERILELIGVKEGEKLDKEKIDMQKHFIKSLIAIYGKELDIKVKQMAQNLNGGGGGKNFIFIMDGLDKKNGRVAAGNDNASLPMQFLSQILNTEGVPDNQPDEEEKEDELDAEPA